MSDNGKQGKGNRLAGEKSPYLLQHAGNPVDWFPWGEEAFAEARRLDRPVFLSIGYATCHWCHVMERESFEDAGVAELMNGAFVNIKVDREERPDLDHFYMAVCHGLTGSGGWPLTIVMTPDKKPFFAGTYFPRTARFGRAGMVELVPRIDGIWKEKRGDVLRTADEIVASFREGKEAPGGEAPPVETALAEARDLIAEHYDSRSGGFGGAPKFPHPGYLGFLLRSWRRSGDGEVLEMVQSTLTAMRGGGVYDQVGFGFHRYSTDEGWFLPHFEKMLYDQALLSLVYTEAWQAAGAPLFRRTAEEIFTYVIRDMAAPQGGFCSAEDADSEGEEGTFYLWRLAEVEEVLGSPKSGAVKELFGLEGSGNFTDETGRKSDGNIFHRPAGIDTGEAGLTKEMEEARSALFEYREKHPRPLRDDKVLTDWNGLMIAALAKGAAAFRSPLLLGPAEGAAAFLLTAMRTADGRLLHRWREGEADIAANLDDYAFFAWGLLELYQATWRVRYLAEALRITEEMLSLFRDDRGGGLFFTAADSSEVPVRQKIFEDGAVPSGNAVAASNLLRLARMTGRTAWEERAAELVNSFAHDLKRYPAASCHLLGAVEFAAGPSLEVVVAGISGREDTLVLLDALNSSYQPNLVKIFVPLEEENPEIARYAPHAAAFRGEGGRATAFVCSNFQCSSPTTDRDEMLSRLSAGEPGPVG